MWALELFLGTIVIFLLITMLLATIMLIALLVKSIMELFEDDDKNFWNKS